MYLVLFSTNDFVIFHLNLIIPDIRQDNSDGEDEVSNETEMNSITITSQLIADLFQKHTSEASLRIIDIVKVYLYLSLWIPK